MQPALFDSSIYIAALRRGSDSTVELRRLNADAPLWLSAVVLEELYAGATSPARQAVERLERDFVASKRVLLPNLSDWTQAGQVLARLAAKYNHEKIGQGRLTNDALIVAVMQSHGVTNLASSDTDFDVVPAITRYGPV